jgi:hypothetical protein
MYYLNILIDNIDNQYCLKLIQKSFQNDINFDDYVYTDYIKSSNKFSKIEMKAMYQDLLMLLKHMLLSCKLVNFVFSNNNVKNESFIKFYCEDDKFEIVCAKLEHHFNMYQTLHEYIDIPMDSESTDENSEDEVSDEGEFEYY